MDLSIRQATPDDVDIVVEYNARIAAETEQTELDRDRLREGVIAILNDKRRGLYFLAGIDDRPVGQISVTYEWSDWRNANFWWLQSVYVEAAHRGQGIFSSLFNHVVAESKVQSRVCGLRLYVDRENGPAHAVYARLGFKPARYDMMELGYRRE
jgi:GNAT superfamily N-acetyltransferase